MLAASPAGMPTGLALPGGITVATASPAGAWPRDGFAGCRLMTEAWSGGVPGQLPAAEALAGGERGLATWAWLAGSQARHT